MATLDCKQYHLRPFWDDSFKYLTYKQEDFNDPDSVERWRAMGFTNNFTGEMCDMRMQQPAWNHKIVDLFELAGWRDIGTSYYRMLPGTVLPQHSDTYKRYVELFNLQGKEHTIRRAIIFLEDWQSGHYLEMNGRGVTNWDAGDVAEWNYDIPHIAANMGTTPRYTLQVTGHKP